MGSMIDALTVGMIGKRCKVSCVNAGCFVPLLSYRRK